MVAVRCLNNQVTSNRIVGRCLRKQGMAKSTHTVQLSLQLFRLFLFSFLDLSNRNIHIWAVHLSGHTKLRTNALSRNQVHSVNLSDLSAMGDSTGLPSKTKLSYLLLTRYKTQMPKGPEAFLTDWNKWVSIYLFPPLVNDILF